MHPQVKRQPLTHRAAHAGAPSQPQRLSSAVNRGLYGSHQNQDGVSLLELMLVTAVIGVGMAVVYGVAANVSAAAKNKSESNHLQQIAKNIQTAYSASGNYSTLSTSEAVSDKLFPKEMMDDHGGVTSAWGSPVTVIPTDVVSGGSTSPDWGFIISYDNLPSRGCVDLVSRAGTSFSDIRVEGTSVGVGAHRDQALLGELCNRAAGAKVQFVYARQSTAPVGNANLSFCNDSLPGAQTQVAACPSGQFGLLNQSRSAFCSSAYGSFSWTPWADTGSSCATCPAAETHTATQTLTCPSGQLGVWTQTRTEKRTAICPVAGPNGPTETWNWDSWVPTTSWVDSVNTCAMACVLPSPSTTTQWADRAAPCPTGQTGVHTWQAEQQRVASCPAPTGAYTMTPWTDTGTKRNEVNSCTTCPAAETQTAACPAGQAGVWTQSRTFMCSGTGGWGTWTTVSNTCATCPAPQNQQVTCPSGQVGSISQSRNYACSGAGSWNNWTTTANTCTACPGPESQTLSCPSGQYGSIIQGRTFSCSGTGSWSAWTQTSNTCSSCPAPTTATEYQWAPVSQACPAGQSGVWSWEKQQQHSRSVSYSCPAGTPSLPPVTYGSWGTYTDTGATRNLVNTCTPICVAPAPLPGSQSASCPAGQVTIASGAASFTQSNTTTYACTPAGALITTPGPWSPTVTQACAAKCVAPATAYTPLSQSASCPAGQVTSSGASAFTQSRTQTTTYSCSAPTGAYTTNPSTYSPWAPTVAATCAPKCVVPNPSTVRAPSYYAGSCPGGMSLTPGNTSATWLTYTTSTASCTSPTGSVVWSTPTWDGTGGVYVSGCAPTCVAPPTSSVTETQVLYGSTPCRYDGATTYNQNQQRTATTTYSCPAPTGSYVSNPTTYTPWANVGGQYNIDSSTCVTCVATGAYVYCRRDGVEQDMRAGDVLPDDELLLINPGNGAKRWGRVSHSSTEKAEMVRLHTASEITLRCSKTAPIGLYDGTDVLASESMDCVVAVEVDGVYGSDTVVDVEDLGVGEVQLITCENDFFLAGDEIGRYLAHHNKKIGYCVSTNAFVLIRRDGDIMEVKANEVVIGDEMRAIHPKTGELSWALVTLSAQAQVPVVTFATEEGIGLTCSRVAPIGLRNGFQQSADRIAGSIITTVDKEVVGEGQVTMIKYCGKQEVQTIECGGVFFLAGDTSGRYVTHHD